MEAIDLLLEMAYRSGAGVLPAHCRSLPPRGHLTRVRFPPISAFRCENPCLPCASVVWGRCKHQRTPLPAYRYGNVCY